MNRITLLALLLCLSARALSPADEITTQAPAARAMLDAWHAAEATPVDRRLHLVLWTPADRDPAPRHRERLSAMMRDIREFYAREMERNGFGRRTIRLVDDADGLTTYDELVLHGTDPAEADSDNDGLPDDDEIFITYTNPQGDDAVLFAGLENTFSVSTAARLALTPAGIATTATSSRIEVGFLHSPDGSVWSPLDLANAVLEPMTPPGRLRLRVPAPSPTATVWLVRPAPTQDPH